MTAYRHTFISHAHADNELCDRYANALRARGVPLYYDRATPQVGHDLSEALQREVEQARALIVMVTPNALGSFWVREEISMFFALMAKDPTRLLIPIQLAPCELPPRLAARWWVDALATPFEQVIDAVTAALVVTDTASVPAAPHPVAQVPTLPPHGPAHVPAKAVAAHHLTPMPLYNLGFRGYSIGGVECILPPLCPVPSGIFIMGSDKAHDPEAYDNETPQYPVEVGPFAIGQHPVTVAEYACFVRATQHTEPKSPYNDLTWQTQLAQRLDHPVVNVSWHDAVAYAAWLAQMTGQRWRLPTEAQWEKAARWDAERQVSRIYPWGDAFDEARCNTEEGGKGTTTPVGSYPSGAGPCGAQDMAGNVWEWTSSLFTPYPYRESDGREAGNSTESRVLRGGSWYDNARCARAAYRLNDRPGDVDSDIGFRLVCAVPNS